MLFQRREENAQGWFIQGDRALPVGASAWCRPQMLQNVFVVSRLSRRVQESWFAVGVFLAWNAALHSLLMEMAELELEMNIESTVELYTFTLPRNLAELRRLLEDRYSIVEVSGIWGEEVTVVLSPVDEAGWDYIFAINSAPMNRERTDYWGVDLTDDAV